MARKPISLLAAAAACVAGLGALLSVAYFVERGRWLDLTALTGFVSLDAPVIDTAAHRLSHLGDPLPVALMGGSLLLVAFARGRPGHALAAAVLLAGANVTTQLLKPALAYSRVNEDVPGVYLTDAAFPSGHATAAMSLALAAVVVAPRALRPVAAAGGAALTLAISFSLVVLGWHLPSDVAGGYLVAATWCFLVLAGLRAMEGPGDVADQRAFGSVSPERAALAGTAFGVVAAVALVTVIAFPRAGEIVDYAQQHTIAVVVAAAVAAFASALVAAVTSLELRRPG